VEKLCLWKSSGHELNMNFTENSPSPIKMHAKKIDSKIDGCLKKVEFFIGNVSVSRRHGLAFLDRKLQAAMSRPIKAGSEGETRS
jgi:hypothetical protein